MPTFLVSFSPSRLGKATELKDGDIVDQNGVTGRLNESVHNDLSLPANIDKECPASPLGSQVCTESGIFKMA